MYVTCSHERGLKSISSLLRRCCCNKAHKTQFNFTLEPSFNSIQFNSIQFNSNNFIIPQEIHMWCITLKTESTSTLQDTKRQINQSIQDAVLKVTIKKPNLATKTITTNPCILYLQRLESCGWSRLKQDSQVEDMVTCPWLLRLWLVSTPAT